MLVLKSEDFCENPTGTLEGTLSSLGLPEGEPKAAELDSNRTRRRYEPMDSATRRRLEGYFEPHNNRLYEYLGVDFGW